MDSFATQCSPSLYTSETNTQLHTSFQKPADDNSIPIHFYPDPKIFQRDDLFFPKVEDSHPILTLTDYNIP